MLPLFEMDCAAAAAQPRGKSSTPKHTPCRPLSSGGGKGAGCGRVWGSPRPARLPAVLPAHQTRTPPASGTQAVWLLEQQGGGEGGWGPRGEIRLLSATGSPPSPAPTPPTTSQLSSCYLCFGKARLGSWKRSLLPRLLRKRGSRGPRPTPLGASEDQASGPRDLGRGR
jgi:hypothetical protein